MKRFVVIFCTVFVWWHTVWGQDIKDYRYYKFFEETEELKVVEDENIDTLFIPRVSPKWRKSLFEDISSVVNDRRGVSYYNQRAIFRGVELPQAIRNRSYRLGMHYTQRTATTDNIYTLEPLSGRTEVGFNLTTRGYRGGFTALISQTINDKFSFVADVAAKAGADSYIDGVYTNQLSFNARVNYRADSLHNFTLIFSIMPTERALRGASVSEAFTLTSDNYYNPSWGYQSGKVRSANIRKSILPTAILSYNGRVTSKTEIASTVSITAGSSVYTALDWLNTENPKPDYYLNMPSYSKDSDIAAQIAQNWVERDSGFTQIDFDNLYRINSMLPESIYVMGEQVAQELDIDFCTAFSTTLTDKITLSYGLEAQYNRTTSFKRLSDLLGGREIKNIDYFLVEDDNYSTVLKNDLRNEEQRVGVGDKYSYNYAMTAMNASVFGLLRAAYPKFDIEAGAQLAASQVRRRGYFQKELYSSNSYGKSAAMNFAPFEVYAAVAYKIGERHKLSGSAAFSKVQPESEALFIQPLYNNRNIDNPTLSNSLRTEVGYEFMARKVALRANLFAYYNTRQTSTMQMYDDIAVEYVDVVAKDISTLAVGAEIEALFEPIKNLRLTTAVSVGKYAYQSDPKLTIYVDSNNAVVASDIISHMSGLSTGRTPQIRALARISYYKRGWSVNLGAEYNGLRYVIPTLNRRTDRVAAKTTTTEQFDALISQQRLPDAFTMDFMVSKRIYLEKFSKRIYRKVVSPRFLDRHPSSNITFMLAIDNLLGNSTIAYRGYESSRLYKDYGSGGKYTVRPHPTRYLYAYPRTLYFQAKFSF